MNQTLETTPAQRLWRRTWSALVDANPVLAKELLVTARTPTFLGAMIVAPGLVGAFVLFARMGMSRWGHVDGHSLFDVYFTRLAIALGIFGAALGSTVIVQEREAGALEALKFSSLGARSIVLGKWGAVVLGELALVACTSPLLAYIASLGGAEIGETCVALAIALGCGIMTASVGVAVSAHANNTRRSMLVSLMAAALIGIGATSWLVAASAVGPRSGEFGAAHAYFSHSGRGSAVVLFIVPAYVLATVVWLGYAAATSGLLDPSEDRSLPIKRWLTGTYVLGAAALSAAAATLPPRDRAALAGAAMIVVTIVGTVLLFAFAAQPVAPTRRMRVHPRWLGGRLFHPSCLAASILFVIVSTGAALVLLPALSGGSAALEHHALWASALLATLGGLVASLAARLGPTRARQLGATVVAGLALFLLAHAISDRTGWRDALCPLGLDPEQGESARRVWGESLVGWGITASLSLGLMLRAVRRNAARRVAEAGARIR